MKFNVPIMDLKTCLLHDKRQRQEVSFFVFLASVIQSIKYYWSRQLWQEVSFFVFLASVIQSIKYYWSRQLNH